MTPEALDKESDYMGHCVGKGGYDEDVENGSIQIYSIRDELGEPHATFEVRDGKVLQCKGKANKSVVGKYVPYVQKFVIDYKLELEHDSKNMGLCQDIRGNWHNIYNIPAGTEFNDLDLSGMDFERLLDLTKIKVNGAIDISECENLTSLEGLPEGLEKLRCDTCNSLKSLEHLPKNLRILSCISCKNLASLEGLLSGLEELSCQNCESLCSLKGAPEGLKKLDCTWCTSLTTLKGLPDNMAGRIVCNGCYDLNSLEGLSPTIEGIDVAGCNDIKYIPDIFLMRKLII